MYNARKRNCRSLPPRVYHSRFVFLFFFFTTLPLPSLCSIRFVSFSPILVSSHRSIRPVPVRPLQEGRSRVLSRDGEGLLGRDLGAVPGQMPNLVAAVARLASGGRGTRSIGTGSHAVASVMVETLALVASDGLSGSGLGTEPTPHAAAETSPKADTRANAADVAEPAARVALLPGAGPAEAALHHAPEPSGTSDLDARAVG
jgi:hypothetical protein